MKLKPAVKYLRVSSKDQDDTGRSIPAQDSLLDEYAEKHGFLIEETFVDVYSGSKGSRKDFARMVKLLRKRPDLTVLCEKTDRLHRNIRDEAILWEIDPHIHLVLEGTVLGPDAPSHVRMMQRIRGAIAEQYSNNLSEEVRKGYKEKLKEGLWPGKAFIGYRATHQDGGRRTTLELDPERSPLVKRLFEMYASGNFSLDKLVKWARQVGLRTRKGDGSSSKSPIGRTTIERLFTTARYHGFFEWHGNLYEAKYPALITPELWNQCQAVRTGKPGKKAGDKVEEGFQFSRLIQYEDTDMKLVGERKIKKASGKEYVYYRPSNRIKGRKLEYIPEKRIEEQVVAHLDKLAMDPEYVEFLAAGLQEMHEQQRGGSKAEESRLKQEKGRLTSLLDGLVVEKMSGGVELPQYLRLSKKWNESVDEIDARLERLKLASRDFDDSCVRALELVGGASRLYSRLKGSERRNLLEWLYSNFKWANGKLSLSLREPFTGLALWLEREEEETPPDEGQGGSNQNGGETGIRTLGCCHQWISSPSLSTAQPSLRTKTSLPGLYTALRFPGERKMAKIFLTRPLPDPAAQNLEGHEVRVHPGPYPISPEDLLEGAAWADALIALLCDTVNASVLEAGGSPLRAVGNYAVGVNNIDLPAAKRLGVPVVNTPDVLTEATAEFTWALLLSLTRRVLEGDAMMREGSFEGWAPELLLGNGLHGRTLGIVGMGRIGQSVARKAQAFGMHVLYHNRNRLDSALEASLNASYVSFEALLKTSDVVSLHAPLTEETHHLLDGEAFTKMKKECLLLNTSRGPLVDEAALVEALRAGTLRGAALDVFENEPTMHPGLRELRQVVLAPHIGSATVETRAAMADLVTQGVVDLLKGEDPKNRVA